MGFEGLCEHSWMPQHCWTLSHTLLSIAARAQKELADRQDALAVVLKF